MTPNFRLEDVDVDTLTQDPTTIRSVKLGDSKKHESRCDDYSGYCGCSVADPKPYQKDTPVYASSEA
jgi:hypothetical protein